MRAQVAAGGYRDASEVVDKALRALEKQPAADRFANSPVSRTYLAGWAGQDCWAD